MVQKQGYRNDAKALPETGMESKLRGNTNLHGERRHLPAYVTNLGMPLYLSFRHFWMQPTFKVPGLTNEDNFNANELSLRSADYWQGRNTCSLQRDLQGY